VIQVGTPEEIIMDPNDGYVADFVKGISRLGIVKAKSIMTSVQQFEQANGPFPADAVRAGEDAAIGMLIKKLVNTDGPIVIENNARVATGVVTQKVLLNSIAEHRDE
jgi:glycine betaine/proline transport system ATP-binding protein